MGLFAAFICPRRFRAADRRPDHPDRDLAIEKTRTARNRCAWGQCHQLDHLAHDLHGGVRDPRLRDHRDPAFDRSRSGFSHLPDRRRDQGEQRCGVEVSALDFVLETDMVDLSLKLGRIALTNPVLVASGTFGYIREMAPFVRLERLGGVIPKTATFLARAGNPTPRPVETASGLLNAIGLDNDGIHHFISHHLPYLRTVGTAVIANIAGEDEDQFVAMAEMLGSEPGLAAIELNI